MAAEQYAKQQWWKSMIVYQIYPASFAASGDNQKGWGNIKGIILKLDYLKELGVDAIWTSPIYKSPQVDMGYDIADYKDIDEIYGTLEEIDRLIEELGKREMKLIMDLVVNHTSDQHEWFKESKSSKSSPKRDFYVWRSPRGFLDGRPLPPNNWASILGDANSAWTWHEASGEFYLALFTPEQPDLNWENPQVRHAVHDVMRFWLDKGVKGFRLDVINLISKDQSFPNANIVNEEAVYQHGGQYYLSGPRFHEFIQEMHHEVLDKYDCFTVGESGYAENADVDAINLVGAHRNELNTIFQFEYGQDTERHRLINRYIDIDQVVAGFRFESEASWNANDLAKTTEHLHSLMRDNGGWLTQGKLSRTCRLIPVLENHDQPRSVTRFTNDNDQFRELGAKLLALMETTLGGTLFLYQGQELGLRNMPQAWPVEEYIDVLSINYWKKMQAQAAQKKDTAIEKQAKRLLQLRARDHARVPIPWDNTIPNAGFCSPNVTPWMRVLPDALTWNAAAQQEKEDGLSVWQFWRRGLANRKEHADAFVYGEYKTLPSIGNDAEDVSGKIWAYERKGEKSKWLVVLNFTSEALDWTVPDLITVDNWVAGNYSAGPVDKPTSGKIKLLAWEGLLGNCSD